MHTRLATVEQRPSAGPPPYPETWASPVARLVPGSPVSIDADYAIPGDRASPVSSAPRADTEDLPARPMASMTGYRRRDGARGCTGAPGPGTTPRRACRWGLSRRVRGLDADLFTRTLGDATSAVRSISRHQSHHSERRPAPRVHRSSTGTSSGTPRQRPLSRVRRPAGPRLIEEGRPGRAAPAERPPVAAVEVETTKPMRPRRISRTRAKVRARAARARRRRLPAALHRPRSGSGRPHATQPRPARSARLAPSPSAAHRRRSSRRESGDLVAERGAHPLGHRDPGPHRVGAQDRDRDGGPLREHDRMRPKPGSPARRLRLRRPVPVRRPASPATSPGRPRRAATRRSSGRRVEVVMIGEVARKPESGQNRGWGLGAAGRVPGRRIRHPVGDPR